MFVLECIYINYLQGTSNYCLIVMVGTPMAFICLTADELGLNWILKNHMSETKPTVLVYCLTGKERVVRFEENKIKGLVN